MNNQPNMQYMPYMQQGMMPMQYGMMPMMMEEDNSLERMYPRSYYVIMPMVRHHCDRMYMKHGNMHTPCREELDEMVEDIYKEVEDELEDMNDDKCDEDDDKMKYSRQRRRNRFLRDLIGILLIRELIGRRRRPYNPYYGYQWY